MAGNRGGRGRGGRGGGGGGGRGYNNNYGGGGNSYGALNNNQGGYGGNQGGGFGGGGGGWGNQGGGGYNNNQGFGGGRGGGRQTAGRGGGRGGRAVDTKNPKDVLREDLMTDRPGMWPLSCYGKGDEPCLLGGDTCFEELRWVTGAAASRGIDPNQVFAKTHEFIQGKETDIRAILNFPMQQLKQVLDNAREGRMAPAGAARIIDHAMLSGVPQQPMGQQPGMPGTQPGMPGMMGQQQPGSPYGAALSPQQPQGAFGGAPQQPKERSAADWAARSRTLTVSRSSSSRLGSGVAPLEARPRAKPALEAWARRGERSAVRPPRRWPSSRTSTAAPRRRPSPVSPGWIRIKYGNNSSGRWGRFPITLRRSTSFSDDIAY